MLNENNIDLIKNNLIPYNKKIQIILNLAEEKNLEIYPIILEMIDDPMYKNKMGSLIYALRNYPPNPLFAKAIDWIINGNFEVAHEAFEIINNIDQISGKAVFQSYLKIQEAITHSPDNWRVNILNELIEMFE
ncbi:MAG: hypothetical protein Q4G42_00615 [Neisseria sp.]|nr:hypothetical protein [Neisseria sp.]